LVTGRKLLLADDSATIQKVVDLTFTDEGLEVITVSDGQQAIEKLDEVVPDIVLADVYMPGLNGYQVCEYIKRTERLQHIPVMLLVGSFEPFDEAEARRVGADDYLTKPFQSIRTLIGKVGTLLSGGRAGSEEATTRKLAMPPGVEEESRPDEESIERATADTAPLRQHEREEMERHGNSREVSFADLSMDDQMIEATPVDDYSGSGQPAQHARPTAQYSAADMKEAGITQPAESASAPEREVSASVAYAPAQAVEQAPAAVLSQSPVSSRAGNVAASDDALLDLGDLEPPSAMTEADDFFLDLLDEAPEQPSRAEEQAFAATSEPQGETAALFSAAEEMDASARVDYEEETAETVPPAQDFVEAQVVADEPRAEFAPVAEEEASPVAEYQSVEGSSSSAHEESSADMHWAPTERLPEAFPAAEAAAETHEAQDSAGASRSPVAGQITLEQLSPEVIDAIARRAVEQLSERVVEQIAWEVVPQLAELLIKRRLEEENK
jgi:CheY-like chemotaxis protein